MLLYRHFEEKAEELEEVKRELLGRVEELEEENDHLKRLQLMQSEAKSKLREETSRLTAENMVRGDIKGCECNNAYLEFNEDSFVFSSRTLKSSLTRETD